MTILSATYNPKIYDGLGDIVMVAEMIAEEQLKAVGQIILEHGYEKDVNVGVAHRHFDLAANEVMLETCDGDVRIAKPVNTEMLASIDAQPNIISLSDNNVWYPVAYGIGKVCAAWNDHSFLKDVTTYLIKNNLHDKIVLAARDPNYIKKDGFCYMEKNIAETRTSENRLVDEKHALQMENTIQTIYGFACGDDGITQFCCFNCCASHRG